MENPNIGENEIPYSIARRHVDLDAIAAAQAEGFPLHELGVVFISLERDEVERTIDAFDEFFGLVVPVHAAQDVLEIGGVIVLLEVRCDTGLVVDFVIVDLDIVAAKIFEHCWWRNDLDALKLAVLTGEGHCLTPLACFKFAAWNIKIMAVISPETNFLTTSASVDW